MKKNKIKNKLFNIRIDEELLKAYKEFCNENGYDASKRIRLFINADLSNKLEIKKDV
jgi:antitoxin component of RelBE/YafQ-DinJ toxin-antitoxin module